MVHCAVSDCSSQSKNANGKSKKISFFSLPSEKRPVVRKSWLVRLTKLLPPGKNLSKDVFVCSLRFSDQCFEPAIELQNTLPGAPKRRQLVNDAILDLLPHGREVKHRKCSERRAADKQRQEQSVSSRVEDSVLTETALECHDQQSEKVADASSSLVLQWLQRETGTFAEEKGYLSGDDANSYQQALCKQVTTGIPVIRKHSL